MCRVARNPRTRFLVNRVEIVDGVDGHLRKLFGLLVVLTAVHTSVFPSVGKYPLHKRRSSR